MVSNKVLVANSRNENDRGIAAGLASAHINVGNRSAPSISILRMELGGSLCSYLPYLDSLI